MEESENTNQFIARLKGVQPYLGSGSAGGQAAGVMTRSIGPFRLLDRGVHLGWGLAAFLGYRDGVLQVGCM